MSKRNEALNSNHPTKTTVGKCRLCLKINSDYDFASKEGNKIIKAFNN